MKADDIARNLICKHGRNMSELQQAIADAIRDDRNRHAQALRDAKRRLQEDGAIWWNVGALDDFIAALVDN